LLQGKSPWYALDKRLGGPQSCHKFIQEKPRKDEIEMLFWFCCTTASTTPCSRILLEELIQEFPAFYGNKILC
jgi:hypothetical protein